MPVPVSHDLFDHVTDTLQNAMQRGTTDFGSIKNILNDFGFGLYSIEHSTDSDFYTVTVTKKFTLYVPKE